MIEVINLCKNYGARKAISNLNFKIEKGDVVGLLGPNGAGKSTTMKILTGYMAPNEGIVKVAGFDVFESPLEVKKRIGYLPEQPPLYMDMTVEGYLDFVADLKQVGVNDKNQFIEQALDKTHLREVRKRLIKNLSKGFKQRVGIAQALVSNPEVLILDEPTVGLDPKQVSEVRNLIKTLKGQHTIIVSTHILSEVQATCNKVIIIHQGHIVAQENIENLHHIAQKELKVILKVKSDNNLNAVFLKNKNIKAVRNINPRTYSISVTSEEDIETIAQIALEKKMGLLELKIEKTDLEDIFLKLTYENLKPEVRSDD